VKKCPYCGNKSFNIETVCRYCGTKLPENEDYLIKNRQESMIVLIYFDWFGTVEDLEGFEEATIVYAKEGDVEFKVRYAPDNRKFHFVYVYDTDSYGRLLEALMSPQCLQEILKN